MAKTLTLRSIKVDWTVDGYHHWPEPTPGRAYLGDKHRHRFAMSVEVPVDHAERAIEFHDLLDLCTNLYTSPHHFTTRSCESIAEDLIAAVRVSIPALPWVEAVVSEDGYVSARVRVTAPTPKE